jgi:hypothetical protein
MKNTKSGKALASRSQTFRKPAIKQSASGLKKKRSETRWVAYNLGHVCDCNYNLTRYDSTRKGKAGTEPEESGAPSLAAIKSVVWPLNESCSDAVETRFLGILTFKSIWLWIRIYNMGCR